MADEYSNTKLAAAISLSEIGTPEAKSVLATVVDDEISKVRNVAREAVGK